MLKLVSIWWATIGLVTIVSAGARSPAVEPGVKITHPEITLDTKGIELLSPQQQREKTQKASIISFNFYTLTAIMVFMSLIFGTAGYFFARKESSNYAEVTSISKQDNRRSSEKDDWQLPKAS